MAIRERRKNIKTGNSSHTLTIPSGLPIGEETTLAANRLLLADVRGIIDENDLLEFMETFIEPVFWEWFEKLKERKRKKVDLEQYKEESEVGTMN